jgi:hypothetical protein
LDNPQLGAAAETAVKEELTMKFKWQIESRDIQAIHRIVAEQQHRSFVVDRTKRNVNGAVPALDRDEIWQTQIMCLLTSQQRSGPNRPVSNFLIQKPFPLSLQKCRQTTDVNKFVNLTLSKFGGIRFSTKIAQKAAANFEKLESGGWKELTMWAGELRAQRMQLPTPSHYQLERKAAQYMDYNYEGLGPKQSRNFWQDLGLMRYEFVLDSRITDWLRKTGFPTPLSSAALGDEAYYIFLSDILRDLCIKADVLPCVFDAAVFASYDEQE